MRRFLGRDGARPAHAAIVAGGFVTIVAALWAWLEITDGPILRSQLTRWQFYALEAQFVLFATLSWLNIRAFLRFLRAPRAALTGALFASIVALLLVTGIAPRTNRIYYDEHIYQGIAQNLSDLHLAQMCNNGSVEYGRLQCLSGEYNKQPYGYSYTLSLAYRILGVHEWIAHGLNALCAGQLVWVVFLTTSALFDDPRGGALAALVAALIPQQLLWSHTAAVEPSAALFAAIGVMTAAYFVRSRTTLSLLWMVVTVAFAVQFRPESILLVPIVGLVVALYAPDELKRVSFWGAVLLGVVLCTVHMGHLWAVRGEEWGYAGERMSLAYFWHNIQVNGPFYFDNARFPVIYTVLAFVGLAAGPIRASVVSATCFAFFWGVFLFFHAGSYDYGADVRFSLMSYPAIAILAGRGTAKLHELATYAGLTARGATGIIAAALCFQFLWFMPQVRAVGEEAWEARGDVAFAHRVSGDLPAGAIVLTHNPSVFLIQGINAAQMSLATGGPTYVSSVLITDYPGGVFLHWDYWCNVAEPVQREFCENALSLFDNELFMKHRERNYTYAFYRLKADLPLRFKPATDPDSTENGRKVTSVQ